MKRVLLIYILAFSTAALADREAFVVNNLAETMSRIDLASGAVQNHVTTLGTTPNQIVYSNGFLYVINSISANLQKIDPASYQVVSNMLLPEGSNPYSIAVDNQFAYVSCLVSGNVERINLQTGQISGEVTVGGYPEGLFLGGNRLYVAQTGFNPVDFSYGQGRMAIIELTGFTLENEITVGTNPQSIFSVQDGKLHIVCTGNYASISGAIYVFDTGSGMIVDSILTGGQPVSGAESPNRIAYLAAGGWVDHGYVYSYNTVSGEVLHGPLNPILSGVGVAAIALDSSGFIYTWDFGGDTVTKLNTSGQAVAVYNVGDGPQSLVILDEQLDDVVDQNGAVLPEYPILLGNYPNPFNAETLIKYHARCGTRNGLIVIYDVEGRVVRRLKLGTGGDISEVLWDGRDDRGRGCASGIYLARLQTTVPPRIVAGNNQAIRLLLIK